MPSRSNPLAVPALESWRNAARKKYATDEVEFDMDAVVSWSEDSSGELGAWVAAWVWVKQDDEA